MFSIKWDNRKRALRIREQTKLEAILIVISGNEQDMSCAEQIIDGQLLSQNGNPGMIRQLDRDELRSFAWVAGNKRAAGTD